MRSSSRQVVLVFTTLYLICVFWHSTQAQTLKNSIIVESKTVMVDEDSVWVAVWLSNKEAIEYLSLTIEIRSVTSGTFARPIGYLWQWSNPAGRLENSPLGSEDPSCWSPPWANPVVDRIGHPDTVNWCSGPVSNTYGYVGDVSFLSPDGYGLSASGSCGPMQPGRDSESPDSASIRMLLRVTNVPGVFEIDTCCVFGSHTVFLNADGVEIVPEFEKGVITIACDCSCHADPECNGASDVIDVVLTINRAFRGAGGLEDAKCVTHSSVVDGRTDVDCSGTTDAADVVRLIDVAFNAQLLQECKPCDSLPAP